MDDNHDPLALMDDEEFRNRLLQMCYQKYPHIPHHGGICEIGEAMTEGMSDLVKANYSPMIERIVSAVFPGAEVIIDAHIESNLIGSMFFLLGWESALLYISERKPE
jgi:adenosine deaminase